MQINTNLFQSCTKLCFYITPFPHPSLVLLLPYQLYLHIMYAHQHRFIIIATCSCLLNEARRKNCYKQNIHLYCFHITYMVTFTDVLFFSYRFELLPGALISSQMTLLIFHKADLLMKIFLSFIYPGMSSLYLHLRVSCVGWSRLVWYHFLSIPLVCHPTAFWTS